MHKIFSIQTHGAGLYEITPQVIAWANPIAAPEGMLTLFIRHTSASLVIQENADPEVQVDLLAYFNRLVPPSTNAAMHYLTHTYEGPDDMPAHIKAALLPTHLQIPVINGHLMLGKWQGIYLFEHRSHSHRREVVALLR